MLQGANLENFRLTGKVGIAFIEAALYFYTMAILLDQPISRMLWDPGQLYPTCQSSKQGTK